MIGECAGMVLDNDKIILGCAGKVLDRAKIVLASTGTVLDDARKALASAGTILASDGIIKSNCCTLVGRSIQFIFSATSSRG